MRPKPQPNDNEPEDDQHPLLLLLDELDEYHLSSQDGDYSAEDRYDAALELEETIAEHWPTLSKLLRAGHQLAARTYVQHRDFYQEELGDYFRALGGL